MTNGTQLPSAVTPAAAPYVGAGVLLMRLEDRAAPPRFLLLRGRDTGIWSFSKGHPESEDAGEPLRTALRETREETGFIAGRDYSLVSEGAVRLGKRPYWVGVMLPGAAVRPRLAAGEHSDCGWFTWAEISRLPSNTDVRSWCKKAVVATSGFGRIMSLLGRDLMPELELELEPRPEIASRRPRHSSVLVCSAS
jgi:8-oxo-dGTP pyrophosphatase MutT (NUDIX family)